MFESVVGELHHSRTLRAVYISILPSSHIEIRTKRGVWVFCHGSRSGSSLKIIDNRFYRTKHSVDDGMNT